MIQQYKLARASIRHGVSVGIAIALSLGCAHFFLFNQMGWMVISAYLVSLTTQGTPLRQGVIFTMVMLIAIVLGFCMTYMPMTWLLMGNMVIVISIYWVFRESLQVKNLLFIFILLLALLLPPKDQVALAERFRDVAMGALIGIAVNQIVGSLKPYALFQRASIFIFRHLIFYLRHTKNNHDLLTQNIIEPHQSPEWIYEVGFNPGLRAGFRFFLLNVDHVIELLLSLSYWRTRPLNACLHNAIAKPFEIAMKKNRELLEALVQRLENKSIVMTASDYMSDITALENEVKKLVPPSLELLDLSQDYIVLTAMAYDMKDIRLALLRLASALSA